ncbi:MAG: radical SAM protein [Marinilabiliales bacterium]|nr:MAG: radical SAM protein [Marinilabiliales bacterium]
MKKIKLSLVSYLNTFPFLSGIEKSGFINPEWIEIVLETPSQCAKSILSGSSDVGLLPIGAYLTTDQSKFEVITDYCLGAENEVKSVLLLSDIPLEKIKTICLDSQSRTSNLLVQVLAHEYWNLSAEFISSEEKVTNVEVAKLLIGDRALEKRNHFRYSYDLAKEWFDFTSLPFVFALWVAKKEIAGRIEDALNKSIKFSEDKISELLHYYNFPNVITFEEAYAYLTRDMSYSLTHKKKEAIERFSNLVVKNNLV